MSGDYNYTLGSHTGTLYIGVTFHSRTLMDSYIRQMCETPGRSLRQDWFNFISSVSRLFGIPAVAVINCITPGELPVSPYFLLKGGF